MEFPDTIEGFGYKFNEEGRLQHIETGEPFQFEVKKDDHSYNQKHYEALGEIITPHVYKLLEERCGLHRADIPVNAEENEPTSFIFVSEDYDKAEKLLVLIHGSGVVRAGQWARRLIINDSLDSGTQIPYIERGKRENYGIIVMNTNENYCVKKKKKLFGACKENKVYFRGSEDPERHGKYVWENYIRKCEAKKIAIVAHSYGGIVATLLFKKYRKEFIDRVFALALTDSVHFQSSDFTELINIGRNWITSQLPLDAPINKRSKDIRCVSAGCLQHEMTSSSAFESVFKFFYERLLPVTELSKHTCKLPVTSFEAIPDLNISGEDKAPLFTIDDASKPLKSQPVECEPADLDMLADSETLDITNAIGSKESETIKITKNCKDTTENSEHFHEKMSQEESCVLVDNAEAVHRESSIDSKESETIKTTKNCKDTTENSEYFHEKMSQEESCVMVDNDEAVHRERSPAQKEALESDKKKWKADESV